MKEPDLYHNDKKYVLIGKYENLYGKLKVINELNSDLILEIKRLRKEYGQLRDKSYEKIDKLEQQTKEANEVIEFYASRWSYSTRLEFDTHYVVTDISESSKEYEWINDEKLLLDYNLDKPCHLAGKQAREYLTKYKVKE